METPLHLSHQPIVAVDHYDRLDGRFRNFTELDENTDAMALSLGRAQYDQDELSLKVWRMSNGRWNRQSEELPIHRNLDLSILFVGAMLNNGAGNSATSLSEYIARPELLNELHDLYHSDKEILRPRLVELQRLITALLEKG